jgi:hypothetical protein
MENPDRLAAAPCAPRLQELLVLALQLVVQDDVLDACTALVEPLGFALERPIDLRVVLNLARLLEVRVERLVMVTTAVAIAAMRFEQIAPAIREHNRMIAVAV